MACDVLPVKMVLTEIKLNFSELKDLLKLRTQYPGSVVPLAMFATLLYFCYGAEKNNMKKSSFAKERDGWMLWMGRQQYAASIGKLMNFIQSFPRLQHFATFCNFLKLLRTHFSKLFCSVHQRTSTFYNLQCFDIFSTFQFSSPLSTNHHTTFRIFGIIIALIMRCNESIIIISDPSIIIITITTSIINIIVIIIAATWYFQLLNAMTHRLQCCTEHCSVFGEHYDTLHIAMWTAPKYT